LLVLAVVVESNVPNEQEIQFPSAEPPCVDRYVLTGQLIGLDVPKPQYFPAGHAAHEATDEARELGLYVPIEQFVGLIVASTQY
jgi:hypothetical protein